MLLAQQRLWPRGQAGSRAGDGVEPANRRRERAPASPQAAVGREQGNVRGARHLPHAQAVEVVQDHGGPLLLRDLRQRLQHQRAQAVRGDLIFGALALVPGVDQATGDLARDAIAVVVRHPEGDARQPGTQGARGVVVAPPPPHDEEDLLRQVVRIALADAVPPQGLVDVVELGAERLHAAFQIAASGGPFISRRGAHARPSKVPASCRRLAVYPRAASRRRQSVRASRRDRVIPKVGALRRRQAVKAPSLTALRRVAAGKDRSFSSVPHQARRRGNFPGRSRGAFPSYRAKRP